MLTWPPAWNARGRLARGDARLRVFDAMVDGIADDVRERILDGFKDRLVEFGVAAIEHDAHLAAARNGEIAHQPGQLVPHRVDGLHTRLHDAGLNLAHEQVKTLRRTLHRRVGLRCGGGHDLIAGQHEFADQPHQRVEQVDVNAQRPVADRPARFGVSLGDRLHGQCFAHLLGGGLPMIDQDLTERTIVAELLFEHGDRDVLCVEIGCLLQQLTEQRHAGRRRRGWDGDLSRSG